jgi:hypothetical protein
MWFRSRPGAAVLPLVLWALHACSGSQSAGGLAGTGGATGTGGQASLGGASSTDGAAGAGGGSVAQGGTTAVTAGTGGAAAGGGTVGAGGTTNSGGTKATGGAKSTGGASGTGGVRSTGGASGTGGAAATGGATRTGGASGGGGTTRTGGATGGGGTARTGGASTTGGSARTGGATATGGALGSGGTTGGNSPYKGVANSPANELATLGATWCYNWGTTPNAKECSDPYFVPMIWGGSDVAGAIQAIGKAGYTTVLGFNEPNKSDQANLSVDSAIALWPTVISNPGIRVGSPAVSDDGRSWLESFMTQVQAKGLRVDFIAMHWYGWNAGSCVASQLEGAINWASKWGLPIWITEFGCMGSSNTDEQTVLSFFNNALPMLQKHPLVERYAWYPWNTYNDLYLADANGVRTITALGKAFAAAPPYRP